MAKWELHKLYVNSQGYTPEGYYYGVGEPLYQAADDNLGVWKTFRAATREKAKQYVRDNYDKDARFYK